MPDKESLSRRIDELAQRFNELEQHVASHHESLSYGQADAAPQYCGVPYRPPRAFGTEVTPDRRSGILDLGGKWVTRTNLHYFMFASGSLAGGQRQHDVVDRAFDVWRDIGIGLQFTKVTDPTEAEIRIGFVPDIGSWSTIGTDALTVGAHQQTMNFGWNIDVPGPNGLDTAIHEIGHALGFHHEHQNPNSGILWNREAVYEFFRRTQRPPWSRQKTDFNILDTIEPHSVGGSNWDPNSIMHYAFARGLIRQPADYRDGLTPAPGLSQADKEVVKRFYPDDAASVLTELKPWESQRLTLAPGEQRDFNVLPTATRSHDFRTFGRSDTVIVLFEEEADGDFRYVVGDDDSGFDRNAAFRVRLIRGRKYQLRVRLYFSESSGDTAVMMW